MLRANLGSWWLMNTTLLSPNIILTWLYTINRIDRFLETVVFFVVCESVLYKVYKLYLYVWRRIRIYSAVAKFVFILCRFCWAGLLVVLLYFNSMAGSLTYMPHLTVLCYAMVLCSVVLLLIDQIWVWCPALHCTVL